MTYVPAPGYMPTYNPPLPCSKPVPYGLRAGMSVYIQGVIHHSTNSFRVNFSCGNDIALHFNPRFQGHDKVVLNTFHGGNWGKEEHHHMPFQLGQHFEIMFIVTNEHYQISVNRDPFCEYRHRMPVEQVQEVNVDGDMELQSLTVLGGAMMGGMGMPAQPYPPMGMPGMMPNAGYPNPNLPMMMAPTSYNPQVPYIGNFPGGLGSKRTVVIRGFVPQGAKNFHINFKAGHSDIVLHINPRMNENCVVRNSFLNGGWGREERELPFNPFQPGQYFDLSIRCGNERFKVFANGQPVFNYSHRFRNFQQIDTLDIDGDVILSYVQY
ncbi:galectin-4 [Eublepharis macularius]|uniref:Galectin n=1 Tax=Eublepharis macularius TaxID=481883 RepID=A0AA97KIB1_EUBMA|nr:galectin-4 [Eublepharis macularius]